jgi:hypothetical protein
MLAPAGQCAWLFYIGDVSLPVGINISPHRKGMGLFYVFFTVKRGKPVFLIKKGKVFIILNIGIHSKNTAGNKPFIALVGDTAEKSIVLYG